MLFLFKNFVYRFYVKNFFLLQEIDLQAFKPSVTPLNMAEFLGTST